MKEFVGKTQSQGVKIGVVVSRFNEMITEGLLAGALSTLKEAGIADEAITLVRVPGSFEIPLAAQRLAQTGTFEAIVCLGAVIRGETDHYEMVANQSAAGISAAGRETGVPTIFGVLTTENMEQAINRAGGKSGNLGSNTATTAIETARLVQAIKTS